MGRDAKRKTVCFLTAGAAAVLLAAVLSILYGSTGIPPGKILDAVLRPDLTDRQHLVIRELRIPRTAGCILVGAAGRLRTVGNQRGSLLCAGTLSGIPAGAGVLRCCIFFLSGGSRGYVYCIWAYEPEQARVGPGAACACGKRCEYLPLIPESGSGDSV